MAVVNYYVDPNLAAGDKQDAKLAGGAKALITFQIIPVAVTDSDGSIYRIGKIASNAIMFDCKIATDGITAGTSFDLGLYGVSLGAVVNKNLFMSAQTMAVASKTLDGLAALTVAQFNQPIWKLLGLSTDPNLQYDLAITANTVGSSGGNLAIRLLTSQN